MKHAKLILEADERTEDLLSFVLGEVDDRTLDELEIERQLPKTRGLTAEPVSIAVTITAAIPVLMFVLRIVKTHLQGRQVIQRANLILQAHEHGDAELAELVADIVRISPPGWSVELGPLKAGRRHSG